MDQYYNNSPVTRDSSELTLEQQIYSEPVNEGDLTDEYIVNMMHEISSNNHEHFDYQLMKLFDQMQDVINIPKPTNWHGMPYECEYSTVTEPSTNVNYSPSYFSNDILDDKSPVGLVIDTEEACSPVSSPPGSQASCYSNFSLQASPYSMPPSCSPAGTIDDASQIGYSPAYFVEEASPLVPSTSFGVSSGEGSLKRTLENHEEPQKKKRGRKPKSAEEKAAALAQRQAKSKKIRVYEIDQPFQDKELERKRVNAVNAKKHRDQQKVMMKEMEQDLADVIIERDILKRENEELENKVEAISRQLEAFQRYCGMQMPPSAGFSPGGQ